MANLDPVFGSKSPVICGCRATMTESIAFWFRRLSATIALAPGNDPTGRQELDTLSFPVDNPQDGDWTAGAKWVVSACSQESKCEWIEELHRFFPRASEQKTCVESVIRQN
jgi:hypothetical protein